MLLTASLVLFSRVGPSVQKIKHVQLFDRKSQFLIVYSDFVGSNDYLLYFSLLTYCCCTLLNDNMILLNIICIYGHFKGKYK